MPTKNCALRIFKTDSTHPYQVKDLLNKTAEWIPKSSPVYDFSGKFNDDTHHSFLFTQYSGFYNSNQLNSYNFETDNFTVCFWGKCKDNLQISEMFPFAFYIRMNDGTHFNAPVSITDTEWHFYTLVRIKDNIRFYLDGSLLGTFNTTAEFNMDDNSCIYVGNPIPNMYGGEMYIDDIYIFQHLALWNTSKFEIPKDYQQTDNFFYALFTQNDNNFTFTQSYDVKFIEDENSNTESSNK